MNEGALSLIVLRAKDLASARRFYEAVGLRFDVERHGSGPEHLSCARDGFVFEVYPRSEDDPPTTATRIGFRVARLDETLGRVTAAGGTLVRGPRPSPWGRRALTRDPEGHTVELLEADTGERESS